MWLGQQYFWFSTILNNAVEPKSACNQVQQCRTILLTTRNNVTTTVLLHPVKPENKFQWLPDKVSGTNWMVPDTGHFVSDIKLQ